MARYVLGRFFQGILTLLLLVVVVFVLTRATGNPADLFLPADATQEEREYMIRQLGLDRPYPVQFLEFMTGVLKGDLGDSIRYKRSSAGLVMERLPNSLGLIFLAMFLAFAMAIPLGVVSASRRGTLLDHSARLIAVVGITAPSFWVGLVLIQIFAVQLRMLPASRMGGLESYILPSVTMSLFVLAGMVRLLRSSMIEVLDSEFAKLARIKGVSANTVLWKHCLRNSLIPMITFAGMYFSVMIGGSVVVETIFAWPGVGRLAYEGISYRDYPLVQAVVLIKGSLIVVVNFAVDIFYSYIDPRIRYN